MEMKKKVVAIALAALVSSLGFVSASTNERVTESFSSDARLGNTAFHFDSPNSKVLIVTVEQGDLTLRITGRLDSHGRGRINFMASRSSAAAETGLIFLEEAEKASFDVLGPVAGVVGDNAARKIAEMGIELANSKKVPPYQAHYLIAAVCALASARSNDVKVAWPWDYVAYATCYYSSVTGCLIGCGRHCWDYCLISAEAQCRYLLE